MMEIKLLLLLFVANGSPILAARLLGDRWRKSLDNGRILSDGQPVLGSSKTIRGLASATLITTLVAPLFGFSWMTGLLIGSFAMLGDLLSSFIKRRMKYAPSSMVFGLDQIPESLLPLLIIRPLLDIDWLQVATVTAAFLIVELPLSWLLCKVGIRKQPY